MKKKSLLAFILISLVLFSSCGIITINRGTVQTSGESDTTDTDISLPTYVSKDYPTETETDGMEISKDKIALLPDADLDGKSVFFAVAEETGNIFNEEAGIYAQSVLYRNQLVNEKYKTKLITLKKSASVLFDEVKSADKSGDYFADFAVIQYAKIGSYYAGGYLRNLKSLSYAELSDDCYNQSAMEQLTLGGYTVGAVGYATEQIEHYSCLYFNKTLAEKHDISLDYESIYSGDFTWDVFLEMLKRIPEKTASFVSEIDNDELIAASFFSSGQTYLSSDNDGEGLGLSCSTEASASLIASLKELLALKTDSIKKEVPSDAESGTETVTQEITLSGADVFLEGEALFCFGSLGTMNILENCGFKWEALPLPKINASDKSYSTSVSSDAPIITALASGENIDTIGYVLRALNVASFGYLKYDFYRNAEKNLITGVNTLDMIDFICENPIYDHASMFGGSYKALREGTYMAFISAAEGSRSFEYYLSKNASALNKYLASLR